MHRFLAIRRLVNHTNYSLWKGFSCAMEKSAIVGVLEIKLPKRGKSGCRLTSPTSVALARIQGLHNL